MLLSFGMLAKQMAGPTLYAIGKCISFERTLNFRIFYHTILRVSPGIHTLAIKHFTSAQLCTVCLSSIL